MIETFIFRAKKASEVEHNGFAGEIREIFLSDLITPFLPNDFNVGTGKIVDRNGNLSKQTDIVIYNKTKFPPVMFDLTKGIFPIDSVYYAIEVKTTITSREIKDAIKKAESIRSLNGDQPHFLLFGFGSDIQDPKKNNDRFIKALTTKAPPINICCIVGKFYSYYTDGKWNHFGSYDKSSEIVGLVHGILNTLVQRKPKGINVTPGDYLS